MSNISEILNESSLLKELFFVMKEIMIERCVVVYGFYLGTVFV